MRELFAKYGLTSRPLAALSRDVSEEIRAAREADAEHARALAAEKRRTFPYGTVVYSPTSAVPQTPRKTKRRVSELKTFSEHVLVSRAIRVIRNGVGSLTYGLQPRVPAESETETRAYDDAALVVRSVLDNPNRIDNNFKRFLGPLIEDLLCWDAAVFEYVERPQNIAKNQLLALEPAPGYTFAMNLRWDGTSSGIRWVQMIDGGSQGPAFTDDELEYVMQRRRTWEVFGLSQLETAVEIMDGFLNVQAFQREVASNAYPAFMMYLGDEATEDQIDIFRVYWENDLRGRAQPGFFAGFGKSKPESLPLKPVGDDGLYLQYTELLTRILAYAFDLSPMDFGIERDVNRSTAEVTATQSVMNARRPIAELITSTFNARVLPRIARIADEPRISELEMFWLDIDPSDEKARADIHAIYLDRDVVTLDEVRSDLDKPPYPKGFGKLTKSAAQELIKLDPTAGLEEEDKLELEGPPEPEPQPQPVPPELLPHVLPPQEQLMEE
jgi:Phage portal protein